MPQTGIKLTKAQEEQRDKLVEKWGDAAKVYYELKSYGYPYRSACAILGFIDVESGFDLNDNTRGLIREAGLCHWTGKRRKAMMEIAAEHSSKNTWVSVDGQVYYLVYELETEDQKLNKYLLKGEDSVEQITNTFCVYFAKITDVLEVSNYKKRKEAAEKWAQRLKDAKKVSGTTKEYSDKADAGGLGVSAEKLYSSERELYGDEGPVYITRDDSDKIRYENITNTLLNSIKSIDGSEYAKNGSGAISESKIVMNDIVPTKNKSTLQTGEVHGSKLPSAPSIVEAPYVEVTLGGVKFGTYRAGNRDDRYPNYIQGITVSKTNGSLNQYKINLVYQIAPGNNPNYIDELIARNGYDTITITYGDANCGLGFREERALITSITQNFDFVNCKINYVLNATSSCIAASTYKITYPAIEGERPSIVIRDLLYGQDSSVLLDYFPGMRDQERVERLGLIPNNDVEIDMGEVKDTNPLAYLIKLVAVMSSVDNTQSSMYLMTLNEDGEDGAYFKITEVLSKQNIAYSPLMYEVDVGFKDDNLVYDFKVDNNFAWAMAYQYAGTYPSFIYGIDDVGNIRSHNYTGIIKTDSNYDTADHSSAQNWWTQMTEFPVTAKLTVKGLVQPILLMSYIKINCVYFGNKRTTSGVYVVTGQEDSLSGNGFRTTLNLLKVAGDNQFLEDDARIVT